MRQLHTAAAAAATAHTDRWRVHAVRSLSPFLIHLSPWLSSATHTHTFFAAQITRLGGATPSRSPHDDVRAYVYIILDDFENYIKRLTWPDKKGPVFGARRRFLFVPN